MLGPSPDWIVGASALEMCLANCTWLDNKVANRKQSTMLYLLVLQKVASEDDPKVRNHGEGPY